EVNTLLNGEQPVGKAVLEAIDQTYRDLGGQVLGIVPDEADDASGSAEREDGLIRLLIELRAQARADKNFELSDLIRDRLGELGVTVEDRVDGTVWRVSLPRLPHHEEPHGRISVWPLGRARNAARRAAALRTTSARRRHRRERHRYRDRRSSYSARDQHPPRAAPRDR